MRQLKISGENITKRTDNISRYFTDVERNDMLSADREWEIAVRAQKGDEEAIDALVKANLRFVISVAKQYSGTAEKLEDLISQGNIGLIHAAQTFDPSRGFKFISYAVWHIRKEIMTYLNLNLRQIRLPQNVINSMSKINKVQDQLYQREGRAATVEEIYDWLQKSGDEEHTLDRLHKMNMSMYQRVSPLENTLEPEGFSQISVLQSETSTVSDLEHSDINKVTDLLFKPLTGMQREILSYRLGLTDGHEWTYSQLSQKLGKSPEQVRQLYKKAMRLVQVKALRNPKIKSQLLDLV